RLLDITGRYRTDDRCRHHTFVKHRPEHVAQVPNANKRRQVGLLLRRITTHHERHLNRVDAPRVADADQPTGRIDDRATTVGIAEIRVRLDAATIAIPHG